MNYKSSLSDHYYIIKPTSLSRKVLHNKVHTWKFICFPPKIRIKAIYVVDSSETPDLLHVFFNFLILASI